jgi:hypothetical protein
VVSDCNQHRHVTNRARVVVDLGTGGRGGTRRTCGTTRAGRRARSARDAKVIINSNQSLIPVSSRLYLPGKCSCSRGGEWGLACCSDGTGLLILGDMPGSLVSWGQWRYDGMSPFRERKRSDRRLCRAEAPRLPGGETGLLFHLCPRILCGAAPLFDRADHP